MKVYGPYKRNDGRQHVIIVDGSFRRTVSYPKWLMEQKLGRELDSNLETVHHINEDFTDNSEENLEVMTRQKHSSMHSQKSHEELYGLFECPTCKNQFETKLRYVRANQDKQGKAGPYCSRRCAGKMHH